MQRRRDIVHLAACIAAPRHKAQCTAHESCSSEVEHTLTTSNERVGRGHRHRFGARSMIGLFVPLPVSRHKR